MKGAAIHSTKGATTLSLLCTIYHDAEKAQKPYDSHMQERLSLT